MKHQSINILPLTYIVYTHNTIFFGTLTYRLDIVTLQFLRLDTQQCPKYISIGNHDDDRYNSVQIRDHQDVQQQLVNCICDCNCDKRGNVFLQH